MRPVLRFSEDTRQLVHMVAGGVALLLRFARWWQAAVLAAGAVAFNADALPHIASGRLCRELEGRRTFLFPALRRLPPGTSGAVSLVGTVAGVVGAAILGLTGVAAGLVPSNALLPVIAGATIGAFAESALAARFEGPGIVNNDVLNFLNTAIAGASAVLIAKSMA